MNKYVYDSFTKLRETEKAEFIGKFKNSPTVIRFIQFLEKNKIPNFKTRSAIESVYGSEKDKTAYPVLENRFFKLRKKIADELEGSKSPDNSLIHPEEELRFIKAKQLISSENKETAYRKLAELEKICWERNIFELLPAIIDQMIFCNQSFNRLDQNKELFIRSKSAIDLLFDINICVMTARKIYEINFIKGVNHAGAELALMRKLAYKNNSYPRFFMCYHHVSAYYKLGSKDYNRDSRMISRHLNAFKRLQAKFPFIPLMTFKVNYVQQQHLHFNQMIMSYHFGKCEFEETYQVMKDIWRLITQENSIFRMYKTESSYYNMITSQCMTQRYTEALSTIEDFSLYLKTNHQTDKLVLPNVLKARVYADVYPHTHGMDALFLSEQVDEHLRSLKKQDNMMISYDQTLILKLKLLILKVSYSKALQLLEIPGAKNYLKDLELYDPFTKLLKILIENSSMKFKQLSELNKEILALKHKADTPAELMHIYWLQKYVKHQLS